MNGRIVCMVRGGEAGRKVQEYTIDYARQFKKTIIFVHVVDVQTFTLDNERLVQAAREELTWLGRVTLSMARHRAERAGVPVEAAILYGAVFEAMLDYLAENPVESVFLGSPHPGRENYEQLLDRVKGFANRLGQESGIDVQMVPH